MKFIDNKTDGGRIKGKIALYCRVLDVSRQGFYNYLQSKNKPYKYAMCPLRKNRQKTYAKNRMKRMTNII